MTREAWTLGREHGSPFLVRLIVWITLRVGWHASYVLLYPITAYFFLTLGRARAFSRQYLAQVLGREPRLADEWRHFFTYACVILDRIGLLGGRADRFRIRVSGLDTLTGALAQGRGCVLLGSHLGSFDVLRAFGRESPVTVKALMFRGTVGALSTLIEALDPAIRQHVIEIGTPDAIVRVRESLARGEVVGILADRAPQTQRFAEAEFLGRTAAFPTGLLRLAASLEVPVVLFYGLRRTDRRYDIVLEAFADGVTLDPACREAALARWAQRYAARLEAHCRANPFNWFNFYDFWERRQDAAATAGSGGLSAVAARRPRRGATVASAAVIDR